MTCASYQAASGVGNISSLPHLLCNPSIHPFLLIARLVRHIKQHLELGISTAFRNCCATLQSTISHSIRLRSYPKVRLSDPSLFRAYQFGIRATQPEEGMMCPESAAETNQEGLAYGFEIKRDGLEVGHILGHCVGNISSLPHLLYDPSIHPFLLIAGLVRHIKQHLELEISTAFRNYCATLQSTISHSIRLRSYPKVRLSDPSLFRAYQELSARFLVLVT
uniref:Uncharacterized protein n=1 Tax=Brassica oleracea var. oleracea TaxID=109376 RepID=A0A0D3DLN6_BRAOL